MGPLKPHKSKISREHTPSVVVLSEANTEAEALYKSLILPACEKVGYVSRRASDTFKTAPITMLEASRDQILDADVVVALLTNPNPNLSLEIGLTLGLGKPIVLVISKWESIPLDLKPYHLVVNATAPDAVSKLAGLLIATRSRTPKTIWTRRKPVPNYSEWLRTIRTSKKGGEFEGLISDLLLSMKGVEVIGPSPTQELDSGVDLVIWNSSPSSPLSKLGSLVLVECKARVIREPEISQFEHYLASTKEKAGLLFHLGSKSFVTQVVGSKNDKLGTLAVIGIDENDVASPVSFWKKLSSQIGQYYLH